jgi:hypothetical protein
MRISMSLMYNYAESTRTKTEFKDISLMMEAVSISETSVNFYETARRNIPENSHLRTFRF